MRSITLAGLALSVLASAADAQVLYDGSLGTTPTSQGLFAFPPGPFYSTAGGATTLDTTASDTIAAGYTSSVPLTLNRAAGYTIRLDASLLSNAGTNPDRAGFSLIALSSDKVGIELGFHTNEIFAQNDSPLFVRGETSLFVPTTLPHRYDLTILGSTYQLRADGISVLTGPLRDYTAFTGSPDVYETPNFLFLGDDSTSARGVTQLSYVSVIAPEPTSLAAVAAVSLLARRRR